MNHSHKPELLQHLSHKLNIRAIDLTTRNIEPQIAKMLPLELSKEKMVIPFSREEKNLLLAMRDPQDLQTIKNIEHRLALKVIPYVALPSDIWQSLKNVFGNDEFEEDVLESLRKLETLDKEEKVVFHNSQEDNHSVTLEITEDHPRNSDQEIQLSQFQIGKDEEVEDINAIDPSTPEVERSTHSIILEAIRLNASDIHIEPFDKKLIVRYRIDGELYTSTFNVPYVLKNALISKIKILAGMNITERRIPQDGRIQLKVKGKPYEFRVNTIPTVKGESAVLRLLDRSGAHLTLNQLGFLPDTQKMFVDSLTKPYGLILVCGPTGAGKSLTLMASLAAVKNPKQKILTAENPVEYHLDGVVQVQINPDLSLGFGRKFNFATALRSFLRQDPDVIMVGEIRDHETGQVACEAAMTGHLVLSTIHTNDATSVIGRLTEMGVEPYLISSTLECVLAQRLLRTLCNECKVPDPAPSPELIEKLQEAKIPYNHATFMKEVGCSNCRNEGMKGRTAIHEILVLNDEMRSLCKANLKSDELRSRARSLGMRTLFEDGLMKVCSGLTTFDEVLATAK